MNTFYLLLFFITLNLHVTMAQNGKTLIGEYLFNKMEMAAGFNFTKDGKFQFFYTYGASDRNATGTYTIEGDTLKLHSDKEPGNDFTIDKQTKKDSHIEIHVNGPNKNLTSSAVFPVLARAPMTQPGEPP